MGALAAEAGVGSRLGAALAAEAGGGSGRRGHALRHVSRVGRRRHRHGGRGSGLLHSGGHRIGSRGGRRLRGGRTRGGHDRRGGLRGGGRALLAAAAPADDRRGGRGRRGGLDGLEARHDAHGGGLHRGGGRLGDGGLGGRRDGLRDGGLLTRLALTTHRLAAGTRLLVARTEVVSALRAEGPLVRLRERHQELRDPVEDPEGEGVHDAIEGVALGLHRPLLPEVQEVQVVADVSRRAVADPVDLDGVLTGEAHLDTPVIRDEETAARGHAVDPELDDQPGRLRLHLELETGDGTADGAVAQRGREGRVETERHDAEGDDALVAPLQGECLEGLDPLELHLGHNARQDLAVAGGAGRRRRPVHGGGLHRRAALLGGNDGPGREGGQRVRGLLGLRLLDGLLLGLRCGLLLNYLAEITHGTTPSLSVPGNCEN